MTPGIGTSGSAMLTQKCGVTERFSLNTRQITPMFLIASYCAFASAGRPGIMRDTRGVGTVEITASAGIVSAAVRTPVTRPRSITTSSTGSPRRTSPPRDRIASTRAVTNVPVPPSMWPSSSCISDLRERPSRLMRVQIQAAEMSSA